MFKCEKCGVVTKSREKMNKLVVKTRDKGYINKVKEQRGWKTVETEKITSGWEIVKEISVCEDCYRKAQV